MLIKFQAPGPWWSRGVQLLWLLPQAKVETETENWDLAVLVEEDSQELSLTVTNGNFQEQRVVPARPREFLQALFLMLSQFNLGPISPWGILTGVRPGKVAAGLIDKLGPAKAVEELCAKWLLHVDNARLLAAAVNNGYPLLRDKGLCLYISVPFCPSRCDYCSFASLPLDRWRGKVDSYVRQAAAELKELLLACRRYGHLVNSIYVGGGTPTALSPRQLEELLAPAAGWECEFTVEAGRPDTLTREHLAVFKDAGVNRISVNSQYPEDRTLAAIGRKHTAKQFFEALDMAVAAGLGIVNSDLIIGLPGQTPEGFAAVISRLAAAGAENITIHALALKRGAEIRQQYLDGAESRAIAAAAYARLDELGFQPYYLYRQRNMASNLENVGFGLPGSYCYYNIASIAESEPVLGVGAGAASKLGRADSFISLVNPRDVNQYLTRSEDLLQRKLSWLQVDKQSRP
ncbi:MAG: coproporphyrinogen dehydrogenase HemZ [Eubacteriales bacterium]|nr:coproporphyrinogen dehydrogenase HemZ [Eubacteriales bacterium]